MLFVLAQKRQSNGDRSRTEFSIWHHVALSQMIEKLLESS